MPDVLIESLLKITHDPDGTPTVLLDYGEDITELPALDGEQVVEVANFVEATAAQTFARGNETHSFRIAGAREALSLRGAHDRLFSAALAVPRGSADVLFEVQSGGAWRLTDATVRAWPARVDAHFCDRQIEIIGGELVQVTPPPSDSYTAPTGSSPETYLLPGEQPGTGGGEGGGGYTGQFFVKYVAQTLDAAQQAQARTNIGAASQSGLAALDTAAVKKTGNQIVAGVKTFTSAPKSTAAATVDDDLITQGWWKERMGGYNSRFVGVKKTGNPDPKTCEIRFTHAADFYSGFTQILVHGTYSSGIQGKGASMVSVMTDGGTPFANLKTGVQVLVPGLTVVVYQDGNDLVLTVTVNDASPARTILAEVVTARQTT